MSFVRLFNYSVKIAAWATPHLQRWMRNNKLNEENAQRNFEARNYDEAEKYYTSAILDAERRHYSLKRRIELRLQLAETLRRKGDLDRALVVLNEAIEKTRRSGPLYGECLDALAAIHMDRGEPNEALEAARAALDIARRQRSGPAMIAERCCRLAATEQRCGNAQRQMELLQESISLYEKAFGAEHVQTADRLADMGAALRTEGKFTEALMFLDRACSTHQKLAGVNSPEYLADLEQLAATQHGLGNSEEAARLYDRVLRLKENQVGLDRIAFGRLLVDAAEAYAAAENDNRAYETVQYAMRLLDRRGLELGSAGERIVGVLETIGRPADAEAFRKRVEAQAAAPVART